MVRRLLAEPVGVPLGSRQMDAVVLGASTGGPPLVERILRELPADFPVPVAICQHMPAGFTSIWGERLDSICRLRVREAVSGEPVEAGNVYIAPAGLHMRFCRDKGGSVQVRLDRDFCDSLHVPSIDVFLSSAAQAFGSGALAVLLTGLGSDGALGMLAIRRSGGHTIAEAPDSAVAYSMPGSAVELSAVVEEVTAEEMAGVIAARAAGVL